MLHQEIAKNYGKYTIAPIGLLFAYLLKRYFNGGVCKSKKRLDGKVVIVTGANCGIGYEAALDFAKRGAHVILACRDMKRAQNAAEKIISESKNTKVEIEILDCASFKSVREFCARINKRLTRLDILVNNAGLSSEKFQKTIDGFELTFQVNHLSHFLLTNLLIDLLKASASTRVINISSTAHYGVKMKWNDLNLENSFKTFRAYQQSKLANVLFSMELSRRYQEFGIISVSLHPGAVTTEIWRNLEKKRLLSLLIFFMKPLIWFVFKNSKQGAQTTLHCALDDDISRQNGLYFSDCKVKKPSTEANFENAAKLWDISLELTCLK